MSRWTAVVPGAVVSVRGKRSPLAKTVLVASLLEKTLADGPGFVDTDGNDYRAFYFDVTVLPAGLRSGPVQKIFEVTERVTVTNTYLVIGTNSKDAADRLAAGQPGAPRDSHEKRHPLKVRLMKAAPSSLA